MVWREINTSFSLQTQKYLENTQQTQQTQQREKEKRKEKVSKWNMNVLYIVYMKVV